MITIVSPSKTLDFENSRALQLKTTPQLVEESAKLMEALKKKSVKKLMELQSISRNLAELNYERNQVWNQEHKSSQTRSALTSFQGDVYVGLNAQDFSAADDEFAIEHFRILSGLYGILKPTDQIMPYRLEMGTKLKTKRGKDVYAFWKNRVTDIINAELEQHENAVLLNLASDEYFHVLSAKAIKGEIIQPVFMDKKNGKYKVISFFAKKARGLMSRFIIKNKVDTVEDIKAFDYEGYIYNAELSAENKWVFTRDNE